MHVNRDLPYSRPSWEPTGKVSNKTNRNTFHHSVKCEKKHGRIFGKKLCDFDANLGDPDGQASHGWFGYKNRAVWKKTE